MVERLPELLDDLLVVGVGEQDPVGATAEEHPRAPDVPALPRSTSAPLVHAHATIITHHARSPQPARLVRTSTRYIPSLRGPAAGAGNQGGLAWHVGAFVRRHRGTIASGAALAVAVSAVIVYAVTASGYKAHQADLNDGGVWVVNGTKGWSGRLNKPINQLDGVVPSDDGKTRMDIIQDGAAVVALDINAAARPVHRDEQARDPRRRLRGHPERRRRADGRRHPGQRRRRDRRGLGRPLRRHGRQAGHERSSTASPTRSPRPARGRPSP